MTASLACEIKASIDDWAQRLLRDSELARVAQSGSLSPRVVGRYLESLRYVFVHSHRNVVAAAARADQLALPQLAAYFRAKAAEESGHDQWAEQDLSRLPAQVTQAVEPAAASRALVALQADLLQRHPLCFLAYAVWAEYLTARYGGEWLRMLASSGYDRTSVSAVTKHVEADADHALEGFEALDRFWQAAAPPRRSEDQSGQDGVAAQPSASDIMDGVRRAQLGFEAFCAEICQ